MAGEKNFETRLKNGWKVKGFTPWGNRLTGWEPRPVGIGKSVGAAEGM